MKTLYHIAVPNEIRGANLDHPGFTVPASTGGYKVASYLSRCTPAERLALLKTAVERDTRDLAEAYNAVLSSEEDADDGDDDRFSAGGIAALRDVDDDDDDDDDYGAGAFYGGEEE